MAVSPPEQKPAGQAPSTSPLPSPAAPPPAASSAPIGGGVAFAPVNQRTLAEIDKYYRAFDPTLPKLEWKDKDGDGRIDLFDRLGNEYDSDNREVPVEWAHLLRSVAVNHHETRGGGVELSSADWMTQQDALKSNGKSGRVVLPNGLQVIVEHDPDRPFVWMGYVPLTGSNDEIPAQRGISHGLEHVLVGSSPIGGRKDFEERMAQLGGGDGKVNTGNDRTLYSSYVERAHLREAFLLRDQALTNENYDSTRIRDEISDEGILGKEISRYRSDVLSSITTQFEKGLYPDHPIGEEISGDFKNVKGMTLDDFRRYHANTHVPNNVAIKFYGNVTLQDALKIVQESRIGQMRSRPVIRPTLSLKPPSQPTLEIVPSKTETMPPTKTTEVRVGWRVPDRINMSDPVAFDVALALIRVRMDRALVKTGMLEQASIGFYDKNGVGVLTLRLSGSADKIPEVMVEAQKIIEQVKKYPPDAREIESIQRKLLAQDALEQEDGQEHITPILQRSRYIDPTAERAEWLRRIPLVDAQAVQKVTGEYLGKVGAHTLVVLETPEEGKKLPAFPTSQELLGKMQAVVNGDVLPPALTSEARPVYPKAIIPNGFQLRTILTKPAERLPDGRLRYRLKNGMTVTHVPTKTGRVISAQIRSPMGDATDPLGKEGLRALLKRNLFRGTDSVSLKAFEQERDFLGATYSLNNSEDNASISLTAPSAGFTDSLQLLLYAVQNPRLSEDDLRETKLSMDKARNALGNNLTYISTYVPAADLYPNPMILRPSFGTPETVERISRDDLNIYRRKMLDPTQLEVTLEGHFRDPTDLDQVLYALSKMQPDRTTGVIAEDKEKSATRNSFEVVPVSEPAQRESLGVRDSQVTVTHTPRKIRNAYVTQQMVGPLRNSPDYPYYYAFNELLAKRNFYRLVYGKMAGRPDTKGYLYKAWTSRDVKEMGQPALIRYEFECEPYQIGRVLADYRDEYLHAMGKLENGKATQEELRKAIQQDRIDWLKSLERGSGKVKDSIRKDNQPWYFRNADGAVQKVTDLNEIESRLSELPIDEVLRIGGKYFDPINASRVHIVGKLPEVGKSNPVSQP